MLLRHSGEAQQNKPYPLRSYTPFPVNWAKRPDDWRRKQNGAHLHELWSDVERIHEQLEFQSGRTRVSPGRPPQPQHQATWSPHTPESPLWTQLTARERRCISDETARAAKQEKEDRANELFIRQTAQLEARRKQRPRQGSPMRRSERKAAQVRLYAATHKPSTGRVYG